MAHRRIVETIVDPTEVVLDTIRGNPPEGYAVERKRTDAPRLIWVRADLQNSATPISRYVRVGLTAIHVEGDKGRADLAFDAALEAAEVLLTTPHPRVLAGEIQAGPVITSETDTGFEVAYVTLLLELSTHKK